MSRWIDEEWLLDYFADDIDYYGKYVREDIKDNMPSIEIVRCGECKYWKSTVQMPNGTEVKCLYGRKPDDFCSYGSRSEKPNNYCDDCLYNDTCDSKEFFYACTSKATRIAKGEQTQLTAKCLSCNNSKACKENHWEGCIYEPKDEKTCETCRHWKYIAHEWQCEACKCQGYEPKTEPTGYNLLPVEDEPQTERSE